MRNVEISLRGLKFLLIGEKTSLRLRFEGKEHDIARRRWFVSKGTVALRYTRQLEHNFFRYHSANRGITFSLQDVNTNNHDKLNDIRIIMQS